MGAFLLRKSVTVSDRLVGVHHHGSARPAGFRVSSVGNRRVSVRCRGRATITGRGVGRIIFVQLFGGGKKCGIDFMRLCV